ncbi:TrbC/VirB2 family protein [Weissella tructae]|uniref:Prophage protein n=1 Tax=Weissella tructae TaxID=887702 RepID=A0ABM5QSB9_9LACO|nr:MULTISPECIES: TrbC/VirB2 family protein [Weissella]AIG65696.1 Prophage protein [Weissella tructae]ELA06851.1 hypothetical protein WCNC_04707 [Weissella ceti NC36]QVV90814.1 hypothetical protein KHQ32_04045 [Weissella tructae]
MTEKQAEKLALPIIGIVLGSLGLLLSWVPIVNNFAFFLAVIALILTGISFLVNRGGKKTLTYVSLGLAVATGAIVMMTQASYSKALDSVTTAVKSDSKSESKSADKKSDDKKSNASYEDIYEQYSAEIKAATPGLIEEYNTEAASNTEGVEGLAKISTKKIEKLAKINTDGISEMAKIMYKTGSGNGDAYKEYEDWGEKLTDVYMAEGEKITDAYMASAMN